MPDLDEQIKQRLRGRFRILGMGNVHYGDDGLGVRLAEKLNEQGMPGVIVAGTMPERFIGCSEDNDCDNLLFVDAVEFGGAPGSVVLMDAEEISVRFPQVSTHKISLGLLAKCAEENGKTKASLLGVQPGSLKAGGDLTPAVQATLETLSGLLYELWDRGREEDTVPNHHEWPHHQRVAEAQITEVTV